MEVTRKLRSVNPVSWDWYSVDLTEKEAMELHEFLSQHGRGIRSDGRPSFEIRLANELYENGLSKLYHEKWAKEYDL